MRVISGKYRGRNLIAPEGLNTRPTMDRVKEAMFNILGFSLNNKIVLDVFSGSGALVIEALSRGARKGIFNDLSKEAIKVIKTNIKNIKLEEPYELFNMDYNELLENLNQKIDIVILDPPYKMNVYEEILNKLLEKDLLNEDPILVFEMDLNNPLVEHELFVSKMYKYGNKKLQVLKRKY